ncbi:protein kinase [Trypanosoma theileri]|uniref:Protein kinase n=1 Tax=Trypanosoma theileri TaxID=67003 RepID=A0A1X0P0R3_9TRYP|nr:protein kinase [Trypanosoma theileri]ORC90431.1 protein kinase [Trypanosoma theileri]
MMSSEQRRASESTIQGVPLQGEQRRIDFDEGYYIGTVDENGRMSGHGKAVWKSGDTYVGGWLNDVMDGNGLYTWADGDYYEGEYKGGLQNGYGVLKDATGVYSGEWVDDMRHGLGKMEYVGGSVYEGEWLANMRHGQGKLTEANGDEYHGEFVRNEKEGKGIMTNAEGEVYEGEFAHGKPNGKGTYIWADGAKYVGSFKDGLKHGQGCEWMVNGDWVAGIFVNGEHDKRQIVHKAVVADDENNDHIDLAEVKSLDPQKLRMLGEGHYPIDEKNSSYKSKTSDPFLSLSSACRESNGLSSETTVSKTVKRSYEGSTSSHPATPLSAAAQDRLILTDEDLEGWRQLKIIGKGSFGAVYEALLVSGRTVCCKVIELGSLSSREEMEKLRNEIALMKRLHHPNIVQYYGSQEEREKNTLNIFMEFVSGGSLNTFVKKFKTIPLPTVRQWTYQMLCGVKYLHDCGIVHRDIKGDNVLVSLDGIIKLADFGCSKAIDDVCSKTHGCQTMVGTPYWMAPEVIKCEAGGYGMKSDIWSIGCTVVEMITGKPPWPECNSMWAAVYKIAHSTGLPTEIPKDLDPKLMNFLELCFERDPRQRPTAEQLLHHPFLAI